MRQRRRQGFLIKFSCLPAVSAEKCMGAAGESQGNRIASHNSLFGRDITFAPVCLSFTPRHFICCGRFCCKHERKLPVQKAKQCKKKREKPPPLGQHSPSQIRHGATTSAGCDKVKWEKKTKLFKRENTLT